MENDLVKRQALLAGYLFNHLNNNFTYEKN